jgi:16S rRNA (guanine(966)-N(2))-methyltransferase RsmD
MDEGKQFEFQVIAGKLKGRKIVAPDLGITRPPLSRLRKSIFDYLAPYLLDAAYLDLFSGTGSYLFEATSRGVVEAVGVELEPKLVESINGQAADFRVADRLNCLCEDVFEVLPKLHEQKKRFDIIMVAPPQYKKIIDRTLGLLERNPILAVDGQIICQHDTSETAIINWGRWLVRQQRKYGNTTYTILGWPE